MSEAITKIIPIILLLVLGYIMQLKSLVDHKTMHNIKRGIINLALPAVLFIAFKDMDLKKEYFVISVIIFIMLYMFYLAGIGMNKILKINNVIVPFMTTGFAFGLLGIPLFGGVYGLENVGILSIFGIGHEFFAWFVYLTFVKQKMNNESFSKKTIINFIKSPIIIAIISGVLINALGFNQWIQNIPILKGVELTITALASMTTPLILIIIGYGIKLERSCMGKAVKVLLVRLIVIGSIGYLVKFFVMAPMIGETTKLFDMAYYTFLILPPPFMLAIFVGEYSTEENATVVNNVIVLNTLLCIILFIIGVMVVG